MLLRGLVLLKAAVWLCGCETARSGLDYSETVRKLGPPKAGQARIVVFREKGFGGIGDPDWEFSLDGTPIKGLKTGTYVYVDRPGRPAPVRSRGGGARHYARGLLGSVRPDRV